MFWDDLLAYSPEILWKLNDAVGDVAVDSSGHGRDGAYVYAATHPPTLGQASLIPNRPLDTSVRVTNTFSQMVQRAHEAWMNGDTFTFGMFYKPVSIPAQHDLFGKQERVQVWVEADGKLTYYEFDSDWRDLTTAGVEIVAGNVYWIVITCSPTSRRLFVNGVRKINASGADPHDSTNPMQFGHSSTSVGRFANGYMQGGFWIASSLSDAQVLALYNSSQVAPSPPSAPTAFTHPLAGEEYIDVNVPADWGDSAPNVADNYELQYSADGGGSWSALATPVASAYSWNPAARPTGTNYKLRVRGVNAYGNSAWVESGVFSITHLTPGLNFRSSGTVDDIVHNAPALGARDEGEDAVNAWSTDLVPDAAKWTPIAPRGTRWREGYGFYLPMPGGYIRSLRQNVKKLRAYGGARYDDSGTLLEADPSPAIGSNNPMMLQHVHLAANTYGMFKTKVASVCLWRDPVTGSALIYDVGHPASLRFYDGPSHGMGGDIAGTLHYADGSTASSHQPLSGSFGSVYDDDTIEVGFSVVGGHVTLYYAASPYVVLPTKWTVDLSLYISVNGGIAYAMTSQERVGEWISLRVLSADYIAISGLQPGWTVKAEQRVYESWQAYDTDTPWDHDHPPPLRAREAVSFRTITAVADGAGIAKLYGYDPAFRRVDDDMPEWDTLGAIDYTITTPDRWTFDWLAVYIDADSEVDRYTDLKNVRIGDVFIWAHKSLAAYKPAAFVSPVADEIVGAVLPQAVTITAHAPAHPEAEAVNYQWEYSGDGVTWTLVQDWQAAVTFNWDHHLLPFSRTAQLRVRARGTVSLIPSAWLYSGVFVLYHSAGALATNDVLPDDTVTAVSQVSAFLKPTTSPGGHKGTHWKVWHEEDLVIDIIAYGDERVGVWVTGLSEATRYEVQYALVDYLDVTGAFSAKRDFWTLRLAEFSPHTADDTAADSYGNYRNVAGSFIDGIAPGMPEIISGGGTRLNVSALDYDQVPSEFPFQTHHMVRMNAVGTLGYRGIPFGESADYREGFTALLVMTPLDLSTSREIMGQAGGIFAWHDNIGRVRLTAVMQNEPAYHVLGDGEYHDSGNVDFNTGRTLTKNAMQSIFVGGKKAWYTTELAILEPSGTLIEYRLPLSPETDVKNLELWLGVNGSWDMTRVFGYDRFFFCHNPGRQAQWDIGHGSSNADASEDVEASGRFARIIPHVFVFWNHTLDAADVTALASFIEAEDLEAFWAHIADMDVQPISKVPFAEYPRPGKPTAVLP